MIGNRIIFARALKGIVYYYDQRTRVLLCCVCEERTEYAEALIERRIGEIKDDNSKESLGLFG